MSFIRIKKIKNIEYAYFVKNKWTKDGARQKVSKYLGKIIRPETKVEKAFDEIIKTDIEDYISKNNPIQVVNQLVEHELNNLGFKKEKEILTNGEITYNTKSYALLNSQNKPVVLLINDGHFCQLTIKSLFSFNYKGNQTEVGTELANAFMDAGIKIPSVMFILLFQKVYNESVTKLE